MLPRSQGFVGFKSVSARKMLGTGFQALSRVRLIDAVTKTHNSNSPTMPRRGLADSR